MTLGDRSLEREVLQLFDRQAEMLLARMRNAPRPARGRRRAYAEGFGPRHRRLAGGACGRSRGTRRHAAMRADLPKRRWRASAAAIDEARVVIADLLRAH